MSAAVSEMMAAGVDERFELTSAASAVVEPADLWSSRLPPAMRGKCPRLLQDDDRIAWQAAGSEVPAQTGGFRRRAGEAPSLADMQWLSGPEGRHWIQRRDGVSAEVLYSLAPVWTAINADTDPAYVHACYRAHNDWLAELCAADPDRFIGVARIPPTGLDDAVSELRRSVEQLGLKGALLDAWPAGPAGGPTTSDAFWELAAGLAVPVSIHRPLSKLSDEPSALVAAGMPPAMAFDLNAMVNAFVFERFEALRMVVLHPGAGWAPAAFELTDELFMRTVGARSTGFGDPDLLPSDFLRRHFWFMVQDDRFAVLNRRFFGTAHLMWASFSGTSDSSWPNSAQTFESLTADLPEPVKRTLAGETVSRLYGLGAAKPFEEWELRDYKRNMLL